MLIQLQQRQPHLLCCCRQWHHQWQMPAATAGSAKQWTDMCTSTTSALNRVSAQKLLVSRRCLMVHVCRVMCFRSIQRLLDILLSCTMFLRTSPRNCVEQRKFDHGNHADEDRRREGQLTLTVRPCFGLGPQLASGLGRNLATLFALALLPAP